MSSGRPGAGPHVGAMLRVASNWVRDRVHAGVVADGFADLNPAHLQTFRYPGLDGLRPSELAATLQVSKQAVNTLVGHLEACGYVTREPDPIDGRGRVIRLTTRGRAVEDSVNAHARAAERRIAELLGPPGFDALRTELERVFLAVTDGRADRADRADRP